MSPTAPLFDDAKTRHQAGDLTGAAILYQQILNQSPDHAGALQFLGVITAQQGDFDRAIRLLQQSVTIDDRAAGAWLNLARCLSATRQADQAIMAWQRCLTLDADRDEARLALVRLMLAEHKPPQDILTWLAPKITPPDANWQWHDLAGVCYTRSGDINRALAAFDTALAQGGDPIGLNANKANLLVQGHRLNEGKKLAAMVLAQSPDHPGAWAAAGWAALAQQDFATAHTAFAALWARQPTDRATRLGWGLATIKTDLDAAEILVRDWLNHHPDDSDFLAAQGQILIARDDWAGAQRHYQTMIQTGHHGAGLWQSLAFVTETLDGAMAALPLYQSGLAAHPDHQGLWLGLARCALALGDWATGWAAYEQRFGWMRESPETPGNGWAVWTPDTPRDQPVLVYIEQGIGDTLQFLRFIPALRDRVAHLALLVPAKLHALLRHQPILADITITDNRDSLPETSAAVSLLSLPYHLSPVIDGAAYLVAAPDRQEIWQDRLKTLPGRKIGLHWQGSKAYALDHLRSPPLYHFERWLDWPDVTFVNLQQGEGHDQIASTGFADRLIDWTAMMDQDGDGFADTAAVIAGLDLVITSDTALAHLAGAMGVPVWLMLPHHADWRWGIAGDRCCWYDNMRLFRQPETGDWPGVAAAIDQAWRHGTWHRQQAEQALRHHQPSAARNWLNMTPQQDATWHDLAGIAGFQQDDFITAEQHFRQAVTLAPDQIDYHGKLALCLNEMGRYRDLATQAAIMTELAPDALMTRLIQCWADYHHGDMMAAQTNITALYEDAPDHPSVVAAAVMIALKHNPALAFDRAALWLARHPQDVAMRLNQALAAAHRLDWPTALASLATGLHHHPRHPSLWLEQVRYTGLQDGAAAGLAALDDYLNHYPDDPGAILLRAHYRLALGDADGWVDYAARLVVGRDKPACLTQPYRLWQGEKIATLLIDSEQGFGDLFQMLRLVPMVRARTESLYLRVHSRLMAFLQDQPLLAGVEVIAADQMPRVDATVPILSLPGLLGLGHAIAPAPLAYLAADPALKQSWQQRLSALPGQWKIGLNWQGSTGYSEDYLRSVPLAMLAPLGDYPGARFVNLQQGIGRAQIAGTIWQTRLTDWTDEMDGNGHAFIDTAAVIAGLDLVITSDTAIAHLAGALGVPVWLMVSARPDWRWGLAGDDCPWYPRMRLFRQHQLGQWQDVVAAIRAMIPSFLP